MSASKMNRWLTTRGMRLIPRVRCNMRTNRPDNVRLIRQYRFTIETVNSQLEKIGLQPLHAHTTSGATLQVLASLIALALTDAN